MQGLERYKAQLASHEASQGHNPGRLFLDGWRDVSKAEIKRLYRAGKTSVMLALQFGVTYGDHVAMLKSCSDDAKWNARMIELGDCGVDLERLDSIAKRLDTIAHKKAQAKAKADHDATPRPGLVIKRKGSDQTIMVGKPEVKLTVQQRLVAEMVANANLRAKEKKARDRRGKRGYSVDVTPELTAQLLARHESPTGIK